MKKTKIIFGFALLLAFMSVVLVSCQKDPFSEKDAINLQDQLEKDKKLVHYTVTVVDASKARLLKSGQSIQRFDSATVILTQDDLMITLKTDSLGIAVFSGLKPGIAGVTIISKGFSKVSFVVDFTGFEGGSASNLIPLVPTEGSTIVTVQGSVYYENDLTNLTPEKAPKGTKISAMVDLVNTPMFSKVTGSASGAPIKSIAYNGLSLETSIDSLGKYKINLPATADGLAFKLHVADFVTTQKMLSVGATDVSITSVSKLFGTSLLDVVAYPKIDEIDVTVSNTKVTFSEPISSPCSTKVEINTALSIRDYGVVLVGGSDYTTPPGGAYEIWVRKADGTQGNAIADVLISSGTVSSVSISQQGTGYTVNKDYNIEAIQEQVSGTFSRFDNSTTFTYGGTTYQYLYSVNLTNEGGFLSKNNISILLTDASGNDLLTSSYKTLYTLGIEPNTTDSLIQYEMQKTTVNLQGVDLTGYFVLSNNPNLAIQGTKLKANLNYGNTARYQYNMVSGSIKYVSVIDPGSGYIDGQVAVVFEDTKGTGAKGSATIIGGKIMSIKVDQVGFDYTTSTTCKIYNKTIMSRATGVATVNAFGKIDKVILTSKGSGYSTPALVTFTSLYGLGAGATASAIMNGGEVDYVVVKDGGSGYQKGNYTEMSGRPASNIVNVKTTGIANFDIYLGTGLKVKQ